MQATGHVADLIDEELAARGWTLDDLAERMGPEFDRNRCALDILMLRDRRVKIGDATAGQLAAAFGTSAVLWLHLDRQWRAALSDQGTDGGQE